MKKDKTQKVDKKQKVTKTTRRKFLKTAVAAGAGAVVAPTLFNIRTAKASHNYLAHTDLLARWYRTRDL